MDLNFSKEQFSAAYLRALAAVAGCSVAKPEPDCDGEDLVLSTRLLDTPIRSPKLAVQLKCSSVVTKLRDEISFPLSIKNYDDLRPTNLAVPRILVVVEIPAGENPEAWLDQSPDRLCLLRTAFWISLYGLRPTSNEMTVSVRIPLSQRLTSPALRGMMSTIGNGGRP